MEEKIEGIKKNPQQTISKNVLDDYDISYEDKDILGRGLGGYVRKGYHKETELEVAIKRVTKEQCEKYHKKYPHDEVYILQQLDHPNILKLFEVVIFEEDLYLITEVLGDLLLDHTCKTEEDAKPIFAQICSAVAYMHSSMVCHRDLKLENILFDRNHQKVKLIDFGFAIIYSNERLITQYCGSPDYASPELWKRIPYRGPDVDIWALGVILYAMLTTYVPFDTSSHTLQLCYNYPKEVNISRGCKLLLNGIFQYTYNRATIKEIISDPWMTDIELKPPIAVSEGIIEIKTYEKLEVQKAIEDHHSSK
jgi:serine/threonine protein kinase